MRYKNHSGFILAVGIIVLPLMWHCGQSNGYNERTGSQRINRHPDHLIFTKHARCRMQCRNITESEIREILNEGSVNDNKSEPNAKPDPKYAIEGYTIENQHLRVIFAEASDGLVVVTCMELGVEWQCNCN